MSPGKENKGEKMKKIIKGKVYDTDTAKLLAEDSYSNTSQFDYWLEELYLKKTGEYFLYGEGGGLSPYAEYYGNNSFGRGEKITPFTEEEAKAWAEKHISVDEYEKIFGEITEDFSLSDIMKSIRKDTGLSQKAFAEKFEIPKRTIENWESGDRAPAKYVVKMIKMIVENNL